MQTTEQTQPPIRVSIGVNELKAIAPFASKDETRFAIQHVLVELRATRSPIIVATDGRRLAALQCESDSTFGITGEHKGVNLMLEAKLLKQVFALATVIRATKKAGKKQVVFCADSTGVLDCVVFQNNYAIKIPSEDAKHSAEAAYPFWRKVIPKDAKGTGTKFSCVDHQLLSDFVKAGKILCPSKHCGMRIRTTDELDCISVKFSAVKGFIGCIMPMRTYEEGSSDTSFFPDFTNDEAAKEIQAQ